MSKYMDLTGQRFGKLTVVNRTENGKYGVRFVCLCDCGNDVVTYASDLRNGSTVSCGCKRSLPIGEGAFRAFYRYTAFNAKYRGIEFSLSIDFFKWITKQACHYCGAEPQQVYQPNRSNGCYIYNGIDRVDNERGYIPENSVPCCGKCHYIKSDETVENFKDWVVTVYNHWASKS